MSDSALPPPPDFRVNLNNNVVNGEGMLGGYSAWQLWPNGKQIAPVQGKSAPYTIADVYAIYFHGQSGHWDVYYTTNQLDFQLGEEIELTGPFGQPGSRGKGAVNMKGLKSTRLITWEYKGSGKN